MIYVRKLLEENEVSRLRECLDSGEWVDGLASTGHNNKSIKTNSEFSGNNPTFAEISKIIYSALDRDVNFIRNTGAKSTNSPIYSRTSVGGFYRPHQDSAHMGTYSTTVFLTDPNDYDGGELRIYSQNKVEEFKPEAGYAVTYSTGLPHEVAEVTRGNRDVSVFWTKSLFDVDDRKNVYYTILDLYSILNQEPANPKSIEEALEDPGYLISMIMENYKRTHMKLEDN